MRLTSHFLALSAFSLLPAGAGAQDDTGNFPGVGEMSIVFPQNDTYAVVSPFPIIIGFHQRSLLYFSTSINWELSCGMGALFGIGNIYGNVDEAPSTAPYFLFDEANTLGDLEEDGSSFPYFTDDSVSCMLSWDFKFLTECEREEDGSLRIQSGYYPTQSGNISFTLARDGKQPRDALSRYEGCPEAGIAVEIQANDTTCAIIDGTGLVDPNPCDLDVEPAASSLAARLAEVTATLTNSPSTASASTIASPTAGTTNSPSSDDDDESDSRTDDDNSIGAKFAMDGTVLTAILAVVLGAHALMIL